MSSSASLSRRKFLTSVSSLAALSFLSPPSFAFEYPLSCRETPALSLDLLLEEYLEHQLHEGGIDPDEMVACSVYDLVRQQQLVNLQENAPLQCASMVKPLVALAFFTKVQYEGMSYGYYSREMMKRMIILSDNKATNWFMSRLGGPKDTDQLLWLYHGNYFQNLSIVEYIPPSGKTYQNKASAADYLRFLTALWEDGLPYGRELLGLMAFPGSADRIDFGIPDAVVYNKTGSTGRLCGDMGIVTGQTQEGINFAYAFVMIIQSPRHRPDAWTAQRAQVIRDASRLVYEEILKGCVFS